MTYDEMLGRFNEIILDNERLRTRLAKTQDSHAEWQGECYRLYDLLRDCRRRVSWMVMNAPAETKGWAECSALVDEIDQALTITGDSYWKRTTSEPQDASNE